MFTPNPKVINFLKEAELLKKTSMTMRDIFVLTMKRNEKQIAVEYINEKGKRKKYRYSKVRSNAYSIASNLSNLLIQEKKNAPIVLKMPNNHHWGEFFWAILMSGYKPLLIDAKANYEGTTNLIRQSKAVAIISDDMNNYDVMKITSQDLINGSHHFSFTPNWENEVIFCSSGTTGDVKLMVFNGKNICEQICCSLDLGEQTNDIMYPKSMGKIKNLAMIPFHHIFGFVAVFLWYSYYGKTLVFPASNKPSDIQSICQKNKVTHVFSVPLFWDSLAQNVQRKFALMDQDKQKLLDNMIGFNTGKITKDEAGLGGSSIAKRKVKKLLLGDKIKYCISGGGFLSNETQTFLNGIGYNLYNGFGMTEIGVTSVELSSDVETRLKGAIGIPFHGVEYKIENVNELGEGELKVKSPTIHKREIINGVEKETTLDENGFFATGDIATKDRTGRYYLKGRIKDVIINADGENIYPDELEHYFKGLDHVDNLCVVGVSQNKSNEQKIVLVLEVNNSTKKEELKETLLKAKEISHNLPHKAVISNIYLSKKKLPLTTSLKVKRYLVKKGIENKSVDFVVSSQKKVNKSFEGFDNALLEEIFKVVRSVFSEVLILPEFKIEDNAHWINDLGGDSMSYVEMLTKLQDIFTITFPEEKLGQMSCVNDFVYEIATIQRDNNK